MMDPVGAGALQKAFEQLKDKLKREGLFELTRKRPLPAIPRHIAIVTSPTGAAIRDMLNVLSRRNRGVPVTLVPTLVQGEGAAAQIVEALRKACLLPNVDVIIVGRGGGSIEDLWAFNDEKLARAIAACPVPVISAVGHEIDFTIADFVADLRAPTPSAAAELVVKNTADVAHRVEGLQKMLTLAISRFLKLESQRLQTFSAKLVDPKRRLQDLIQRNDELQSRLQQAQSNYFAKRRLELRATTDSLTPPEQLISEKRAAIDMLYLRMKNFVTCQVDMKKQDMHRYMSLLESLSPLKVVERGYSVVTKGTELVKSVQQLKKGDEISVRLMTGELTATVKEIKS
jgi:exodeoxyribonuclease VII large subunit